jgi:hypothetical protein
VKLGPDDSIILGKLQETLAAHGGVLAWGPHLSRVNPTGEVCAIELANIHDGTRGDHDATRGRWPDFRPINDAFGRDFDTSDGLRTATLLPMLAAYWEWRYWSDDEKHTANHLVAAGARLRGCVLGTLEGDAGGDARRLAIGCADRIATGATTGPATRDLWVGAAHVARGVKEL